MGEVSALECVANVSEGRDTALLEAMAAACRPLLLDVHADRDHHRAVLTMAGPGDEVEAAAQALARVVIDAIDLRPHAGAHPRLGAVDVVPFVPLRHDGSLVPAVGARDRFARWAGNELCLPCFLYGPVGEGIRTLPEVRRGAFKTLAPDTGPSRPHPTAGATAVGARSALVAYNLWLDRADLDVARQVAAALRTPEVRTLAFTLRSRVQISCNLVDPSSVGPAQVFDAAARLLQSSGVRIARTELVGLAPRAIVDAVPRSRWAELDLRPEATIEARMEERGIRR